MKCNCLIKYFIFDSVDVFNNRKVDKVTKDMDNIHRKNNNYECISLKLHHNIAIHYQYPM